MFPHKWFMWFWRFRQIAENRFFAHNVDRVWSRIAHAYIKCCGIEHCDWLKPMDHRKSTPMSKKKSLEIWDFLPSLYECTLQKSNMPLKNLNKPRFVNWKTVNRTEGLKPRIRWTAINHCIPSFSHWYQRFCQEKCRKQMITNLGHFIRKTLYYTMCDKCFG